MNEQLHITLRHYGTLLIGGAVAVILGFATLQHFAPPPAHVHGPVVTFTPKPIEKQAQSAVDAVRAYREIQNSINRWQSIESMAFSALDKATAMRVAASSNLKTDATPAPLPSPSKHLDRTDLSAIYAVTKSATQAAMNDPATHINTNVTIDNIEVPPGRVATLVDAQGQTGIGIDLYRHGQYNLNLGGVKAENHIAPVLSAQYILPHTKLGAGFGLTFDKKIEPGIFLGIRF